MEMELFVYAMVFVFGAIIGSFLNVVIYRLHTGRSLSGRSHCMSCGKTLSWYELFPVFSYIAQWGSCRGCRAYIPSRYLVVEFLTGILFLLVWYVFSYDIILLTLHLALVPFLVIITLYDIRHTIIPDELTIGTILIALGYLGYEYGWAGDWGLALTRVTSGLGAGLFFWCLWRISHGRWIGLGDAKLAFPLGMLVGVGGVFSMVVFSFWIGAVISISLIGIQNMLKRGKLHLHFPLIPLTMKSEVPFAPFLVLGFLLVQLFHADVFEITYMLFFSR